MSILQSILRSPRSIFPGWWVVTACAVIGAYGGGVYFYGFTLFFNPLRDELGITSTQASLVFSLTRLEGAFEGAAVGFLIDRWGARKIMMIGVPMVGIGYILWATVVDTYMMLIVVYVGVIAFGVNGGFFHPALAVANNWFVRRRATAMAVISTAVGIGGAILVPLVGYVIEYYGWRNMALLAGLMLLILVWPLVLAIKHSPESVGLRPDGDSPDEDAWQGENSEGDLNVVQPPIEREFSIPDAFKTKSMWILIAGITLRFTAHTAIMVHLGPILQSQGMSITKAGAAIGVLVLLSIPGRIIVGVLGDRFAKHKVVAILLLLQVLAMVVLMNADTELELYLFIVLWAAAYGAGILNWAIVGDYFGRARFATLRGLMGLAYSWGAVIGPVYAGYMYDNTGTYDAAIKIFLAVTIMSVACFWACKAPIHPDDRIAVESNG
ncbi:MAG: MFS transporter [Dehalococcoidia bacterium]|nr:MFS transporter [Dehalococcoidia bacterium]MQG00222.1 MFS transporter [SAR202 cluster bacterium]